MDYKLERYVLTGLSRSKESQEVYKLHLQRAGLTIFAGLSRLAGLPFTVGGDVKSLGLLLGTSVQSTNPCPLCQTTKSTKKDIDGKHQITNFDDWFSLDPFAHKLRKVADWSNPKLAKELKLKQLNPSIVELFEEMELERVDQLFSFTPLHYKAQVIWCYFRISNYLKLFVLNLDKAHIQQSVWDAHQLQTDYCRIWRTQNRFDWRREGTCDKLWTDRISPCRNSGAESPQRLKGLARKAHWQNFVEGRINLRRNKQTYSDTSKYNPPIFWHRNKTLLRAPKYRLSSNFYFIMIKTANLVWFFRIYK